MDTPVSFQFAATRPTAPLFWITAISVTAMIGGLYASILPDLASEWWNDSSASYGMLIPPIAAFIAWLRRDDILSTPARPSLSGLWLTAAGCLVLLTGKLAAEFFLARISFVMILAGLTLTFWGKARFRRLAFPFVLLATMVPVPALVYNTIAAPLQLLASNVATSIAQFLGVSVFRDGNVIHLARTSLGVEEACSGLHSLSAMVVGSLLLGFVEDLRIGPRILLCLFSVPLAIAINVLRVAGTALLADYRLEYAMGFYHLFSGWLVFVAGFGFLWSGARLSAHYAGKAS
jgi:exosortase